MRRVPDSEHCGNTDPLTISRTSENLFVPPTRQDRAFNMVIMVTQSIPNCLHRSLSGKMSIFPLHGLHETHLQDTVIGVAPLIW